MGNGDSSQSVRVAVNIRPLVTPELLVGCTDCITVYPAQKQVQIGPHAFTFDYVFGSKGSSSSCIYDECVAPLVDALFSGYNGTVLAYGQTGSGKTYTMGTNYNGEGHQGGVIPRVMDTIFSKMESMKECTEFFIRVSFIEIFKEEVFDLLDPTPPAFSKVETAKTTGPARAPIQIRETVSGGIILAGVTEAEVRTKEEMTSYMLQGSLCRATASTNMNIQSSRSHAIFTISMEQKKIARSSSGDDVGDEILIAKLHLVDLAGSGRAKRTGADGARLREGISINKGLLALGNCISALGDDKKLKEGCHVPYRDSKLTRILQDSLGGNSKTVMIACVSPADMNAEETINTLKYANRTRNIQNKAIINRDPMAAEMQMMRNEIEQLQAQLLYFQDGTTASSEEIKILKHKISLLEASKTALQEELQDCRINYEHWMQRAIDTQAEREVPGAINNKNGSGIQALVQEIEHELEVTVRVHEVRSKYERQMQERAKMAEEVARLKEEALIEKKNLRLEVPRLKYFWCECPQTMSPGARNSRIFALENMLATSSSTLVSMASQLSEAEECERAFSGIGRWDQIGSLAEAKNTMNFLFNLASSSRCQLRDREVDCSEKDAEIKDMKEKIVNLVRQWELQKVEFAHQENLMAIQNQSLRKKFDLCAEEKRKLERQVNDLSKELEAQKLSKKALAEGGVQKGQADFPFSMDTFDAYESESSDQFMDDTESDWERTPRKRRRKARKTNPASLTEQVSCSCGRSSFCKTSKCECRAAMSNCNMCCKCKTTNCSNREEA